MKYYLSLLLALLLFTTSFAQDIDAGVIHFVYTSDLHYGINRKTFRNAENVDASVVNAAMVEAINRLPSQVLPADGGLEQGKKIGAIEAFIETGDIANRMENGYQKASVSWEQFRSEYINGLTITSKDGKRSPMWLVPGNHDVSNAIGFYRPMQPAKDASSMAGIYNIAFHPAIAKTKDSYDFTADKINYTRDLGGIHFVFITIWPDSAARIWLAKDLSSVKSTTPVILFAHDPPECDAKHFTNPHGEHDINATDKFENLVPEIFKDDVSVTPLQTIIEQKGLVNFIKQHPNIVAYFHGHSNGNEFYTYTGPDKDIHLPTFRVDSPMKGKLSATDETKLSFQVISIDTKAKKMTVRECLWNSNPGHPLSSVSWGSSMTIPLQ